MSDRAAKQARRAKRKVKQAERDATRERRYRCGDCGAGPLHRGGIVVGGRSGERHYCKACMPAERLAALMQARGYTVDPARLAADLARMDTGDDQVATVDTGDRT